MFLSDLIFKLLGCYHVILSYNFHFPLFIVIFTEQKLIILQSNILFISSLPYIIFMTQWTVAC